MQINLIKEKNNFVLTVDIEPKAPAEKIWHYVATTAGYKHWFEELHIFPTEKIIKFIMTDFEEEMHILKFEENKTISYSWDSAAVTFEVSDKILTFTEIIPDNFPNYARDMRGWLVQIDRLLAVINGEEVPSREKRRVFFEEILENNLENLDKNTNQE